MTAASRVPWSYKGIDVYPHDPGTAGLRWDARTPWGRLRADTKATMRELISDVLTANGLTSFSYRGRC